MMTENYAPRRGFHARTTGFTSRCITTEDTQHKSETHAQ